MIETKDIYTGKFLHTHLEIYPIKKVSECEYITVSKLKETLKEMLEYFNKLKPYEGHECSDGYDIFTIEECTRITKEIYLWFPFMKD